MNTQANTRGDTGVWTDRRARPPLQAVAPAQPPAAAPGSRDHAPDALLSALDAIDYGVLLVDADARVRHANQAALRRIALGSALQMVEAVVRPRSAVHAAAFHRAIVAAVGGRRSLVQLPAKEGSLAVAVVPLIGEGAGAAGALLLLGKSEPCHSLSIEFFAQAHRLTRAESGVLRGLCSGLQPAQIARAAGVAISTVRTQIGSLRSKTEAPSIGDLVRMVMLLPPMAPVLWRAV